MNGETRGDYYNTKCPHCGKINHDVSRGHKVVSGQITSFRKECFHCKKVIHYHATLEIAVTAHCEDPIEALRKPQASA